MSKPENPPAFPQQCADALDVGMVHEGMTLRDWFAGQTIFAGLDWGQYHQTGGYPEAAAVAYEIADAMLLARKEEPQ